MKPAWQANFESTSGLGKTLPPVTPAWRSASTPACFLDDENWGGSRMVSVRFTPLRDESATTVAEPLDLDDVVVGHLTGRSASALDDCPDNKYVCDDWPVASQRLSKVNFDWAATTNRRRVARRRMIGMV